MKLHLLVLSEDSFVFLLTVFGYLYQFLLFFWGGLRIYHSFTLYPCKPDIYFWTLRSLEAYKLVFWGEVTMNAIYGWDLGLERIRAEFGKIYAQLVSLWLKGSGQRWRAPSLLPGAEILEIQNCPIMRSRVRPHTPKIVPQETLDRPI